MAAGATMAGVPPRLHEAVLPLLAKRTMLRAELRDITTLALGSSHGDYAFDPGFLPGAFNLCSRSQDLRHSHAAYRRIGARMPKLRDVVCFYSIFSSGHVLEASPSERINCIALHDVLDLDLLYVNDDLVRYAGRWTEQLAPVNLRVEGHAGFLPAFQKTWFPDSYGVEKRASEHLKLSERAESMPYLPAILLHARSLGHRVTIVVPPARSDYRAVCRRAAPRPFEALHRLVREVRSDVAVRIIDLFDDTSFVDAEFGDFDHLRPDGPGAERLTRRVAAALAETPAHAD